MDVLEVLSWSVLILGMTPPRPPFQTFSEKRAAGVAHSCPIRPVYTEGARENDCCPRGTVTVCMGHPGFFRRTTGAKEGCGGEVRSGCIEPEGCPPQGSWRPVQIRQDRRRQEHCQGQDRESQHICAKFEVLPQIPHYRCTSVHTSAATAHSGTLPRNPTGSYRARIPPRRPYRPMEQRLRRRSPPLPTGSEPGSNRKTRRAFADRVRFGTEADRQRASEAINDHRCS